MRYIKRNFSADATASSECISFLEGIYQSVAETLPDIRDHSITTSLVDSTELLMMDDSYSKPVTVGNEQHKKVINTKFVKKRGPRRLKSGLQVQRDRPETKELRYLAPGRMKDYYNMMLAQHPEGKAVVSFATFYRALG